MISIRLEDERSLGIFCSGMFLLQQQIKDDHYVSNNFIINLYGYHENNIQHLFH